MLLVVGVWVGCVCVGVNVCGVVDWVGVVVGVGVCWGFCVGVVCGGCSRVSVLIRQMSCRVPVALSVVPAIVYAPSLVLIMA